MNNEESVPSREQVEWVVEWIWNLVSQREDDGLADENQDAESPDVYPRRTRRDSATAIPPRKHRERWTELMLQVAWDLHRLGYTRFEIAEILDRNPDAVRRKLEGQRDSE